MKNESKNSLTNNARQLDVVVLAVYLLGGDKKAIDTEDIAVKSHELSPGMFSWQKFPDQINLEIVRVQLSNAKKQQCGELISGSGREGWRLSSNGVDWISGTGKELLKKELHWNPQRGSAGSVDTVRKKREKVRLLKSEAWKSWTKGEPLSLRDTQILFRIDGYSTGKMLEIKIVRLLSLFEDDPEIGQFLRQASDLAREIGDVE